MATLKFYADPGHGDGFDIDMWGSGLGFYGSAGFGASVAVDSYQDLTYVTNANGDDEGPSASNVKWTHANSGEVNTTPLNVNYIPNLESTLNIRFTHGTAVQVQNVELRIWDRNDINEGASGVVTQVYECLHVSPLQAAAGSGKASWTQPAGSSVTLSLAQSPGISGLAAASGDSSTTPDTQHDWYVCLSAKPDSIGSKTQFGLYVSLEYL